MLTESKPIFAIGNITTLVRDRQRIRLAILAIASYNPKYCADGR
jgi:hypothetical protein